MFLSFVHIFLSLLPDLLLVLILISIIRRFAILSEIPEAFRYKEDIHITINGSSETSEIFNKRRNGTKNKKGRKKCSFWRLQQRGYRISLQWLTKHSSNRYLLNVRQTFKQRNKLSTPSWWELVENIYVFILQILIFNLKHFIFVLFSCILCFFHTKKPNDSSCFQFLPNHRQSVK